MYNSANFSTHRNREMCTLEKQGNIYVLTLTGEDEHRLNPTLIGAIRSALSRIRSDPTYHSSSALVTTSQGKFFSNGYDLAWARSSAPRIRQMSSELRALVSDLLYLPMPTIAAVGGHASAAGLILALSHDYILMRKDRGFLYMSEMNIGLKIPAWFMAVINSKIGDPKVRRELVLKASKITAKQGVQKGILDAACESAEETVKQATELASDLAGKGWNGKVYIENRLGLVKEVSDTIGSDETNDHVNGVLSKI